MSWPRAEKKPVRSCETPHASRIRLPRSDLSCLSRGHRLRRAPRKSARSDAWSEGGAAGEAEELSLIELALGDGFGEVEADRSQRRRPDNRRAGGGPQPRRVASDGDATALREGRRYIVRRAGGAM